ncbi:MAG: heparan-alpha-glucosaminide N-acetyltransferase domain-containing protein, partial [Candidatus Thorarchaeota archaeon]
MLEPTEFVEHQSRIASVDVLRGVALVFMIINHFGQTFVGGGFHSLIAMLILFFGIIPAPLFYIVAGISVVLVNHRFHLNGKSSKSIWQWVFSRGILILGLGYLFSIVMFGTIWVLDWSILQLIGLSLIVAQLALSIPKRYRILFPIIIIVLAPFLRIWLHYNLVVGTVDNIHYAPPQTLLDHLSAIIATGKAPLFPWLACPIMGTIIGELIIEKSSNPRRLAYDILVVGSLLCTLVLPFFLLGDAVTQYPLTNGFFLLSTGMALLSVASIIVTVDVWQWWNPASQFLEINGQIALISYVAHHLYGIVFFGVILGFYRSVGVL